MPIILQLIRELAAYEKALHEVHATEASLLATLSFASSESSSTAPPTTTSARPATTLLLFTPAGTPAGMALYFHNYSTWRSSPGIYLEDLFVRESERGKGYGTMLLAQLAKLVLDMEGGRLEWSVLKWNKPSIDFYVSEGIGAQRMEDWVGMRVEGKAGLERLANKGGR